MAILHQIIAGYFAQAAAGYETETLAYETAISAAGGTMTLAQKNAWDVFIKAGKSSGWWSSMVAVYGMTGGTQATHSINVKNPGTYNINFAPQFAGTWSHSSNGAKQDWGAWGASTNGLYPSVAFTGNNSFHASLTKEIRTVYDGSSTLDIGVYNGAAGTGSFALNASAQPQQMTRRVVAFDTYLDVADLRETGGVMVSNVDTSGNLTSWKNGVKLATTTVSSFPKSSTNEFRLGSWWDGGSGGYSNLDTHQFDAFGSGLTDAQVINFTNALNTLQTSMSRPVTLHPCVAFIGDSITARNAGGADRVEYDTNVTPPKATASLLTTAKGYRVMFQNNAESGTGSGSWTSSNSRLGVAITKAKGCGAVAIHVMLGTNDAFSNVSDTDYNTNLSDICSTITAAGLKVILSHPIYVDPSYFQWNANVPTRLAEYKVKINALVNGTTILQGDTSAYAYFQSNTGELSDGCHPNATGIASLAGYWNTAIQATGITL